MATYDELIKQGIDEESIEIFACEECGEEFALTQDDIDEGYDTEICEDCISKLDEEEEEE